MREIKFRAWDKKNNEWCQSIEQEGFGVFINGVVNPSKSGEFYIHDYSSTGQEYIVLCQFTGLHDKNGREIYEGDIVKASGEEPISNEGFCTDYDWTVTGKVVMNSYMWMIVDKDTSWLPLWECLESSSDVELEVIGNIHETPERREGK